MKATEGVVEQNGDDLIDGELYDKRSSPIGGGSEKPQVVGGPGEGELIREDEDGKIVAEAVVAAASAAGGTVGEVVLAVNDAAGGRLVDTIETFAPGIGAQVSTLGPRQADAHGDIEGPA